jgi:tetratricopeptide (TPR) repeat protein
MAVLLSLSSIAFAKDVSNEFDSANKLYEQGKFAEAAAAYEKLIQSGTVSPAVYFNLGNARFKNHESGRAIAAYHRAEQLSPRDPDVRANLQFAQNQIQGPTLLPNRWQRGLNRLTLNEWTTLATVVFWVWLSLLVLIQFRPKWRPALRSLILASGVLVFLCGICLGFAWTDYSTEKAIVTVSDAMVRNGPLEESPSAFTVHDGAELKVLDHKNDWLQVSVDERRVGWLKKEQVVESHVRFSSASM